MRAKILEIRDVATCIPVLAVDMNPDVDMLQNAERLEIQRWHLRRLGYPCDLRPNIAITHLAMNGSPAWNDPYGWKGGARTYPVAHDYIIDHWHELKDGDVICVETICGERETPKVSERLSHPWEPEPT
jgi:hypothetical protein